MLKVIWNIMVNYPPLIKKRFNPSIPKNLSDSAGVSGYNNNKILLHFVNELYFTAKYTKENSEHRV